MPRFSALALVLALASACAGNGLTEEGEPAPRQQEAEPDLAPIETRLPPSKRAIVANPGKVVAHSYNLQLTVDHPERALGRARQIVLQAGGVILSASSTPDASSLNAHVPPNMTERVRAQLGAMEGTVVSESFGANDMTQMVDQLRERLDLVETGEVELERLMRSTLERHAFDALVLQRELNTRERQSLEQQILSYVEQARHGQIYVNLSRPAAAGAPPVHMRGLEG